MGMLVSPVYRPVPVAGNQLLLDAVGVTATRAYSTRKLRAAYAGSAVRIRRSSDNAEQDIGFNGENLDTAAIASFVGANSAFIVKWYDQSGTGDDQVQATAASQFRIVNAGALDTRNGLPCASVSGTMSMTGILTLSAPQRQTFDIAALVATTEAGPNWSDFFLHTTSTSGSLGLASDNFGTPNGYYLLQGSIFDTAYVDGVAVNQTVFGSVLQQVHITCPSGGTGSNLDQLFLGAGFGFGAFPGWFGETVLWATSLSSGQRGTVRTNQKAYWGTP